MDPKFVKLLAEHTFCLCSDNQGSHRTSWGPCAPRALFALHEKDAETLLFPLGQGQLTEKKGQHIKGPIKYLQLMWYPVNTRVLSQSPVTTCPNAAQPIQPWQGTDMHPSKHRWMSAQHHQGLELPQFVLPVRNEITRWLRQGTRGESWYRTVNTTPVLYTEDEPVTSEQHKKPTPAEKHVFLFSIQQSSHFRHRYYLFLKIPFPCVCWSSESPESGSYPFLLLFALKTSLEVLCACVCFVSLASCCWFFFSLFFSLGLDVHKYNKEIRRGRTVACKSVSVLFN